MNANDIPNMLYSILIFFGAVFGALNLHLYLKNRSVSKECRRLESECKRLDLENEVLKIKLSVYEQRRT